MVIIEPTTDLSYGFEVMGRMPSAQLLAQQRYGINGDISHSKVVFCREKLSPGNQATQ